MSAPPHRGAKLLAPTL